MANPSNTRATPGGSALLRRGLAMLVDNACIAVYALALFGLVIWAAGGLAAVEMPGPSWGHLRGFLALTLPVACALAAAESFWGWSPGKRLVGLVVSSHRGGRLPFPRALARNLLKFVPWECGHLVGWHAATEVVAPGWLYAPMALSMGLPVWWVLSLWRTGRTPYDRVCGALVGSSLAQGIDDPVRAP